MQHPFIHDLSEKSMEDLQKIIQDLTAKLMYVYKTQNGALIQQLQMALDSYNTEYKNRMDAIYKKQNLSNKINISNDNK